MIFVISNVAQLGLLIIKLISFVVVIICPPKSIVSVCNAISGVPCTVNEIGIVTTGAVGSSELIVIALE